MTIAVIDYDAGNTANVLRALNKIGVDAVLTADQAVIQSADGLILQVSVPSQRLWPSLKSVI